MKNKFHEEILSQIKAHADTSTSHTFQDSYLGNAHPRYPINAPSMRSISKNWMRSHRDLTAIEFQTLLTSLIEGVSSTEKVMAGLLMEYATADQRGFDPEIFDHWLDFLEGWAEVDTLCTGDFTITQIPKDWKKWKVIINRFVKSKNIHKRRASLVLFCSSTRYSTEKDLAITALKNIELLKKEKHVLITKAISWVLRSMIKNHKKLVQDYVKKNEKSLPAIAVRETKTVLKTGKKTKTKK